MPGLRMFRTIPATILEWDRWGRAQKIPVIPDPVVTVSDTMILSGAGSPENAVIGSVGYLFLRTDGGANTTLYVKESGDDTDTGWAAK